MARFARTSLLPGPARLVLGGILAAVAVAVAAPGTAQAGPGTNPRAFTGIASEPSTGLLNSGLLDLSRFDVRNSLTYGVSSYSGYGTRSGGLWTTELGYRLSDPLRVSVDVGAVLDPQNGNLFSEKNVFLQGFNLDYAPSRHFQLNVSYQNVPAAVNDVFGYRGSPLGSIGRPWGSPLSVAR